VIFQRLSGGFPGSRGGFSRQIPGDQESTISSKFAERAPALRPSERGGHIKRNGVWKVLQKFGRIDPTQRKPITIHGFRATLSTWAQDQGFPEPVIDLRSRTKSAAGRGAHTCATKEYRSGANCLMHGLCLLQGITEHRQPPARRKWPLDFFLRTRFGAPFEI
jgi:hypothetical protein